MSFVLLTLISGGWRLGPTTQTVDPMDEPSRMMVRAWLGDEACDKAPPKKDWEVVVLLLLVILLVGLTVIAPL